MLKDKTFWAGFLAGYFLLVVFPQANVRSMAIRKG
jgi:hypothetical protein